MFLLLCGARIQCIVAINDAITTAESLLDDGIVDTLGLVGLGPHLKQAPMH
jgi:hypothetical protein